MSICRSGAGRLIAMCYGQLRVIAAMIAPPVLRIALAVPFFKSGLTHWSGFFSLAASTTYLFENLFRLHILGATYGFPFPDTSAYLAATAEIILPVLLTLGLATRLAALCLLIMTGVIQLTVPDGWANFHLPWASIALAIMAIGPGRLSVDALLQSHCRRRAPAASQA